MLRGILNSLAFAGFVLLLPIFGAMAWFVGSSDEKFLMKLAVCALSPLCCAMWYAIVGGKRFSYLAQIAIIIGGYILIAMLLKLRAVTF